MNNYYMINIDTIDSNSVYEYVRTLAARYYPDYNTPDFQPADLPDLDEIENISKEDDEEPALIGYSHGLDILEKIVAGETNFPFSREDYDNATAVLESLDAIGLDREKFWLALQFVYFRARERNTNCVPVMPSVHNRISDIISALKDNRTVISIKRPGKKVYAIEDPETRKFLIAMLSFGDAKYSSLKNPTYTGYTILTKEIPKELKQQWWMMDIYDALMFLFDKYCTDKNLPSFASSKRGLRNKTLLISRLIYLMRLTEDESFLDLPNALKLVKKKCDENPRPMMDSGWYNDIMTHL